MSLAEVRDISGEELPETLPRRAAIAIGHMIEAVFMTLFALIGWFAGTAWRIVVLSLEYGFRSGAKWPQRSPEGGESSPEG